MQKSEKIYSNVKRAKSMKSILVGTCKAALYMAGLIFLQWAITGFGTLERIDIVGVLAVGAILRHFVDKEENKR